MAETKFKGAPVKLAGELPQTGTAAPDFQLVGKELNMVTLNEFKGKKVILNIFPSLDTSVCATSVRKFNVEAAKMNNTVVLAISKDLPFAHARFCTTEGIENVITASAFRDTNFEKNYGVLMTNGPLEDLLARAVFVIDENGMIAYEELVPEITHEPDYKAALEAL